MSANFIASALFNHLSRAAVEESRAHAGSRTVAYTRASKWLFVIGSLVGAFVFSLAVTSMPEDRRMEVGGFLGALLLLPLALAGAEVFLTWITFDDLYIYASTPWRGRRRIPWDAVTECTVAEGEYYVTLRTRGYGNIKMNTFMRGMGELMDRITLRIAEQTKILESEIRGRTNESPALAIRVVERHESLAKLVGGLMMLLGLALMLYSAFMEGTKPSDYVMINGELTEFHLIAYNDDSKSLDLGLRESAAGPLRPGLVRTERHFIFSSYPDAFSDRDFFQSARKGLPITLTELAADDKRFKTDPTYSCVGIAALQMDGREYYSLTQYLAVQKRLRFLLMVFGTGVLIGGAIIWIFRHRKLIY